MTKTKLSKKAAKSIATLINQIIVAQHMATQPKYNRVLWLNSKDQAVVSLWENHGIALPELEYARMSLDNRAFLAAQEAV